LGGEGNELRGLNAAQAAGPVGQSIRVAHFSHYSAAGVGRADQAESSMTSQQFILAYVLI
jgi:hypothetical protein